MSKTLIFTDIQVHPFAEWSKPTGRGKTPLLDLCEKTFAWLEEMMTEHACENIIFLGDLFEHGDAIDAMSFDLALEWMPKLAKVAPGHSIALVGNHDIYTKYADINLMRWLELAGWQVVSESSVLVFDEDAPPARFVPYRKYDAMSAPLGAFQKGSLLFGHFDVKGGPLRPGFREKNGADASGIDSFIGHYHHPDLQTSNGLKNWTLFVGAPFHRNWSDVRTQEPRGAIILEYDEDGSRRFDRIENPHSPFFETLDLTREERITSIEALRTFAESYDEPDRAHLRIYVHQGDEEMARTLTKKFQSVRVIPSRTGTAPIAARHLIPSVELEPVKVLTDAVLRDKGTKLDKKKLLKFGTSLLSVAKEDST